MRLPKKYRFAGTEVRIRRSGADVIALRQELAELPVGLALGVVYQTG